MMADGAGLAALLNPVHYGGKAQNPRSIWTWRVCGKLGEFRGEILAQHKASASDRGPGEMTSDPFSAASCFLPEG
ncbi:hypothetical protein EYF80_025688 [Liparis tanakae]|uniref:Uncharacterized protein n=1 Tax=Liparis tanakae TaxID=230148 RepID=A0A4Z2HET5_9TELE|nr:hypothetical protein EYF80_025688 [Liparis tanakae]